MYDSAPAECGANRRLREAESRRASRSGMRLATRFFLKKFVGKLIEHYPAKSPLRAPFRGAVLLPSVLLAVD